MNRAHTEKLRAYWIEMLRDLAPNYFLTFNFGYKIHVEAAESPVIRFFNMVQRSAYGRDWASQYDREWPIAYGFFEHDEFKPALARTDAAG